MNDFPTVQSLLDVIAIPHPERRLALAAELARVAKIIPLLSLVGDARNGPKPYSTQTQSVLNLEGGELVLQFSESATRNVLTVSARVWEAATGVSTHATIMALRPYEWMPMHEQVADWDAAVALRDATATLYYVA